MPLQVISEEAHSADSSDLVHSKYDQPVPLEVIRSFVQEVWQVV